CDNDFAALVSGRLGAVLIDNEDFLPGITRPTGNGEYFSRIAASMWMEVVATVASVGPYMFQTCACGKRASSWAAVCGASVSPQKRNRRTRGSISSANLSSTRHICANDGVET